MNTIDKEIEEFKKNLVTIDELSKNIKTTNENNEKYIVFIDWGSAFPLHPVRELPKPVPGSSGKRYKTVS